MKRKKIKKAIIAVISLLAVSTAGFSLWAAGFIMTGKRQTLDEAMKWQEDHYDVSFYAPLEKENYTVEGYEGYILHAELLKNPVPTDKYMIITHGYTDNRMGSLKYVKMYLELGFNCIIYDLRGHGENEPDFVTYGVRESLDLKALIEDTRSRYPDMTILGLHGESLGAATTVTVMKYKPQVDFAVADCGFSDIENVLRGAYRSRHLPDSAVMTLADMGARFRYHYSLKKMRPIDSLDDNTVPILFIHGAEDSFIPPKNSEDMAGRTKGFHALHIIPKAGHAGSILTAPDKYGKYVSEFISEASGSSERTG